MCSVEMMVVESFLKINDQDDLLEMKREQSIEQAARERGAEELRRTEEEQRIEAWTDNNNRKVNMALGEAKTTMVSSGVDVPVLISDYTQKLSEVKSMEADQLKRAAAFGEQRSSTIDETLDMRLDQFAALSDSDKIMMVVGAVAKGIALESELGTWDTGDPKLFGFDLPDWMNDFMMGDIDWDEVIGAMGIGASEE
tara:strand:+ start:3476 stop:4066 length:591 start_codon:yes stop_codon:yes gene_type:complete